MTKDGVVLSIHDDIQNSRWELRHYLITVYDEARNVLSRHKLIDTPIIIPKHDGVDSIEAETITLCHQKSLPKTILYYNNISNDSVLELSHCHPSGGAQRNLINYFSLPVMVAVVLLLAT